MGEKSIENQSFFDPVGFKPVSVGCRLREYRNERGLSIKELAEKSGLAVNTLSLIENQKSSPSVNTLVQLAKALGIPLANLFEPLDTARNLIRTQKGKRRFMLQDGVQIEDCGFEFINQPLQPCVVTMPTGKNKLQQPVVHSGYEFIFCLSGTIDYFVEGKKYSLNEGDSLLFEAQFPHHWVNPGDEPAKYLLIMVPGGNDDMPCEVHFSSQDRLRNEDL
jgi:transcriptional regulator with XRE-family HTH domain